MIPSPAAAGPPKSALCYGVSPCYGVSRCLGVWVLACVMVLAGVIVSAVSCPLGHTPQRTKARGPKGLQLEVRARMAPRLLVRNKANTAFVVCLVGGGPCVAQTHLPLGQT